MKTKIPIYAKIVGWFFLNVLVLGVIAFYLVREQFGANWLLTRESQTRIRSMLTSLRGELDSLPQNEWATVFTRFDAAYHMKFELVRNVDASRFAGEKFELPQEVLDSIAAHPGHQANPPPPPRPDLPPVDSADPDARPPPPPEDGGPPGGGPAPQEEARDRGAPPPPELITTRNPTRYWLLMRGVPFEMHLGRGPQPTTLIAMTDSLSRSTLLFDPTPWLLAVGGFFLFAVFFSVIFWVPLVRSLTHATKQMTAATERIARGDFEVRVNEKRRDELGRLGAAINQMSARLSGFVGGQKRFLGDIAHELCSPLARMEMGLGVIEQRAPDDLGERVTDVQNEVREMRELVNELLNFSKAGLQGEEAQLESLDLSLIVQNVVERDGNGAQLHTAIPGNLLVLGSRTLLTRAISNVVRNAIRYAGNDGPIIISARTLHGQVIVTITDEGPGVPRESLPRLFDAFYRPDSARARETGGVGLGLAIVKTCVDACKGTVSAKNRTGRGLEVVITLERGG